MSTRVEVVLYGDAPLLLPAELPDGIEAETMAEPLRPSDDTNWHGDDADAAALVAAATHAMAIRYCGDADLHVAQSLLADVLESIGALSCARTIDGTFVVVDVYSIDARMLVAAVARFRSEEPQARLWIGARPDGDALQVETFGLRKLGMREVHLSAVPEASLPAVSGFLNKLCHYVSVTGAPIRPGDSVSFGWVDLRMLPAEGVVGYPDDAERCAPPFVLAATGVVPGVLVAAEPASDASDEWVIGVARAAKVYRQLSEACHSCGITAEIDVPRATSTAVVCDRVPRGGPVEARRLAPDETGASGWVVVCRDPSHDHEPAESFTVVTLLQLVGWAPRLYGMIAAPVGTGLAVGPDDELTIRLPSDGSDVPA